MLSASIQQRWSAIKNISIQAFQRYLIQYWIADVSLDYSNITESIPEMT